MKTFDLNSVVLTMPRQVLVVDDEPEIREIVRLTLETLGAVITEAADGLEGLALLRQHAYDLVICDVRMPRLSGLELYRTAVRLGLITADRVLFLSGSLEHKRSLEQLAAEGPRHVFKPFRLDELILPSSEVLEKPPMPALRTVAA